MTETRYFKTIAIRRETGEWKVFYGLFIRDHHDRAVAWLTS